MALVNHKVTIINRRERRIVHKPIQQAVVATLELYAKQPSEVVIALTDSAEMHRLNRNFRHADRATDVLAFPAPPRFSATLGDVVLNWDMAEDQARRRRVRPVDEAAMLAVHGTLHLLGFDDHTEDDLAEMRRAMNEAMRRSGLPEESNWESIPYAEESHG